LSDQTQNSNSKTTTDYHTNHCKYFFHRSRHELFD
jgi:hypothetical protein